MQHLTKLVRANATYSQPNPTNQHLGAKAEYSDPKVAGLY